METELIETKAEADRLAAIAAAEAAEQAAKVAAAQAALDAQRAEHEAELQRATQASRDAAAAEAARVAADRQRLADERAKFEAEVEWVKQEKLKADQAEAQRLAAIAAAEQARAGIEAARQAESVPAVLLDAISDVVEFCAPAQDEKAPEAPACCAPDGVCTDACSKDDAREESAMWNAITNAAPSDADVMWIAISAVAKEYGWTTEQATTRLAEVRWTI